MATKKTGLGKGLDALFEVEEPSEDELEDIV